VDGKLLGLFPFERRGRASPLLVEGIGQKRVGLSIVGIGLNCCLKLDESLSYLASL
jgi:hypothetical protein